MHHTNISKDNCEAGKGISEMLTETKPVLKNPLELESVHVSCTDSWQLKLCLYLSESPANSAHRLPVCGCRGSSQCSLLQRVVRPGEG